MAGFGDELFLLRGPTGGTDQSANGNDGTLAANVSIVANTEQSGVSAFSFPGNTGNLADNHVDMGSSSLVEGLADFSIGMWIKLQDPALNSFQSLFSNGHSGPSIDWAPDLRANNRHDGNFNGTTFKGDIHTLLGGWKLVVLTYESSSTLSVYTDNALRGSFSISGPVAASASPIRIGNKANANRQAMGLLDDIRLADRVWTVDEMADWYAAGRGYDVSTGTTIQTRRRRSLGGYGL